MKVSIEQTEDGMYSVETERPMAPEMGAVEAEQEMGQTFQTLDEAIEAVRAAFGGDGQAAQKPMMEGEEEFVSGFKQARGGEGMGF